MGLLGKHEAGESRPGGSNPPVSANFMERVLRWLRSMWYEERKEPEKVVVQFQLPDRKIEIEAYKVPEQLHCKDHPDYTGTPLPTNNCNVCWEIASRKSKR